MELNKVFMDTNAILYFLTDKTISVVKADFIISFITEIELLSYPNLTQKEEIIIKEFLKNIFILKINEEIIINTIMIRKKYKLKIPDAIIVSSAKYMKTPLVTDDKKILKIKDILILSYDDFKIKYTK
jgi:predicted nucleic acid-binding protein